MNQNYTDFWKSSDSKKEKITTTVQETWLVENGKNIKLIGKSEDTCKELISETKEK